MARVQDLESKLGVTFPDLELAERALTHASFINEPPGAGRTANDRLAFLGDAVLELLVREELFLENPGKDEGELSVEKRRIVSNKALDTFARRIQLASYMDFGNQNPHLGTETKIRGTAIEALIGAMYLGGGIEKARDLWRRLHP